MRTEKRPVLCTTLYGKPMQASNFVGILYQLRHWIFPTVFTRRSVLKGTLRRDQRVIFVKSPISSHDALTGAGTIVDSLALRHTVSAPPPPPPCFLYKLLSGPRLTMHNLSFLLNWHRWTTQEKDISSPRLFVSTCLWYASAIKRNRIAPGLSPMALL